MDSYSENINLHNNYSNDQRLQNQLDNTLKTDNDAEYATNRVKNHDQRLNNRQAPTPEPRRLLNKSKLNEHDESKPFDEHERETESRQNIEIEQKQAPVERSHKKRANVVLELINSERDFVQHLKDVVEGYLYRARKHPEIFTAQRIKTIFANIEQLYEFQRKFLEELEKCIDWSDLGQSQVGHCFLRYEKGFSVYHFYCNNHPNATSELQELYTKPIFQAFFEECRLKQNMIDISLNGFLLTPIQRICKYPLQLNELLKNTAESHPDYQAVSNALVSMRNCANLANERKRRIEALTKVLSFQEEVENWSGPKLSDTSSILVHSGEVLKLPSHTWSQGVQLFLFDHLLLFCKRDILKRNNFVLKGRICMDTVTEISDADEYKPRKSFKLFCSDQQKWFVFTTKSEKEKDDWIMAFERERNLVEADENEGFRITDHELGIARRTLLHRKRSRSARFRQHAGKRPDTAIVDQLEFDDPDMMINRTLSLPSCVHPSHVMNFVQDSRVVSNISGSGSPAASSQHISGNSIELPGDPATLQQSGPGNWLRKMGSKKFTKSQNYQVNGQTGQLQLNQSPTSASAVPTIKILSHQNSTNATAVTNVPVIDVDKSAIKYDELEKRHRDHMVSEQQARLYRLNNDLPPPPTLFPRSLTPTPFSGTNVPHQGQNMTEKYQNGNHTNHGRPKSSPSHHLCHHQQSQHPPPSANSFSPPTSPHPKFARAASSITTTTNIHDERFRHSRRDSTKSVSHISSAPPTIDGQFQQSLSLWDSAAMEDDRRARQAPTFETELVLSSGRVIRVREDAV